MKRRRGRRQGDLVAGMDGYDWDWLNRARVSRRYIHRLREHEEPMLGMAAPHAGCSVRRSSLARRMDEACPSVARGACRSRQVRAYRACGCTISMEHATPDPQKIMLGGGAVRALTRGGPRSQRPECSAALSLGQSLLQSLLRSSMSSWRWPRRGAGGARSAAGAVTARRPASLLATRR